MRATSREAEERRRAFVVYRDLLVLKWLAEQYAARLDHLEALTQKQIWVVRPLVNRLRAARLLSTQRLLVGEPLWVLPTRAGMNACGLPFQVLPLHAMQLGHIAAMNDVRLHIQSGAPGTRWICERELSVRGRGGWHRTFKTRLPRGHVPDGVAIHEGLRTAIEVELNTKPRREVCTKLDALEDRFDAVLYFCAPKQHRELTALRETGRWSKLEVREVPNWKERP